MIFLIIFHDIFSGNWAPISTTPGWKSELSFQHNPPLETGAQFGTRAGGTEPPTFCLQAWVPTNHAKFGRPARPYKIQNPNLPFGFRILDFGCWILEFAFWISGILDFGVWSVEFPSMRSFLWQPQTRPFVFWILDFGFWIPDFGFWILGLGFWV